MKYSVPTLEMAFPWTSTVPYDVIEEVVRAFVASVLVVRVPVLSASVDPLNVPPGAAPFIEDTLSAKLERIWKRPVPTTSRVAAGAAVPTPTFDEEPAM
jgi:hypothetical protein